MSNAIESPLAEQQALLVGRKDAANACGASSRTWDRLTASGKTPRAVRLGGRPMWRVDELRAWVAAGCPDRKTWEVISKS